MTGDFLIDKFSQVVAFVTMIITTFIATVVNLAVTLIVTIVKVLPTIILLMTIVCLIAVLYAGFEYILSRVSHGGNAVQYRPGKIAIILMVLGAAAIAIGGIGSNVVMADPTPIFDYFGTQLTARSLFLMLSALVFDIGSVLLLCSEIRDSQQVILPTVQ